MKKLLSLILTAALLLAVLTGCSASHSSGKNGDIVILFTNDVHCGINEGVGYAGLAAYKKSMLEKTDYVTLVDCGDHLQGDIIGSITAGELIVDIMNKVGYDYAVFGNHEFDFGTEQLYSNLEHANARYLCCNLFYTGDKEDLTGEVKGYDVVTYGKTKVAFVGISTPLTTASTAPINFEEDGKIVYNFGTGNDGNDFYSSVQKAVDSAKAEGADYVVALGHLGIGNDENGDPLKFSSVDLAAHTSGIDVILDGHSHTLEPCRIVKNKDGKEVSIAQTGTKFQSFGKLTISEGGTLCVGLITDYCEKDAEVDAFVNDCVKKADELLSTVAAKKDFLLDINDGDGVRMIRNREMPLGSLVADSYRYALGCDISIINGGGVRAAMPNSDITYKDIISVNPFGNTLCVVKVKGSDIADMLEYSYRYVRPEYKENGKSVGEHGSFFHLSGLKCTVDTSIPSSVKVDDNDMLIGIGDTRRVSDIKVLTNGEYVPLEPDKEYTLGTINYIVKNGGSGMKELMKGKEIIVDEAMNDYTALLRYLSDKPDLSAYKTADGRITIK